MAFAVLHRPLPVRSDKAAYFQAAGITGHPDAPDLTLSQAVERYGDPVAFTLHMVLLGGGLVATVGDADPNWLKQFDLVS
ncbi:hypothetical protein [Streptomyces cyaneogriseus]|uniref:hypothetical protein n=1 Tax=Streptomyces cyaneogriseus TaxID=68192 RepID=UPI001EF03653|nr:hypothetical protein [Streptomyces cyaneogriseus]